ncbi:MAG: hypothetical protein DRQ43_02120 [Gammaproteobacteria bacterium]|nr:MAG: hypothetical protein DRQ43_02120 [Gammaproteobacteria bacterium]
MRSGWLCCGRFKAIPGTLILGVVPRNTTAKPTTPPHLPNDITFLAGVENQKQGQEQHQKQRIKPEPLIF